jgi:enolase
MAALSGQLVGKAQQIMDSRGKPTVRVELTLGNITVKGDVPAGASKGEDEAQTVSVTQAIDNIEKVLLPLWKNANLDLSSHASIVQLEEMMIAQAGANFSTLGANATLPLSRALWRLAAALRDKELFAYIRAVEPELASHQRVHFLMNIFNGGLHAIKPGEELGRERIDIQEIMVVPMAAATYQRALEMGERIDEALKTILIEKFSAQRVTRADEAGFSVKGLGNSSEAFALVFEAIQKAGFKPGEDVKLALDVAASSFYHEGMYQFQGKQLSGKDMVKYLTDLVDKYPGMLLSIEDGLAENDWENWTSLTAQMRTRNVVTIGDDLFVTQLPRLKRGIEHQAADAILIKVNQNGTVHGTLQVMKFAKASGVQCVVSHRSGETLDDSIADLAYATGSLGLKTGDPQPMGDFPDPHTWVRRVKYLRMVAMEERTI